MQCSRRDLLISAVSLAAARARAQQPVAQPPAAEDVGDSAAFSTGVKVVNVLATVRGKNGALIRDLGQDDFTLLENGRPQTIRYFSRETDLPLSLGLMVDTSLSQGKVLDAERGASFRFIDQVLREDKDQFFVMQFDLAVLIRQGFTNSRQKLQDSLAFVDLPTRRELMLQRGGGTLLYDAVIAAAQAIEALNVGGAAKQVGLNHRAHASAFARDLFHHVQRTVGIGCGFHIHFDVRSGGARAAHQSAQILDACFFGKIESHLRQLQRNGGGKAALAKPV